MVNSKKKAISSIAVGLVAVSLVGFGGSTALGGFGTSTINASTATGVKAGFSQLKMTALSGGFATGPVLKSSASGTVTTQLAGVLSTLEPGAVGTETFLRVVNDSTTADQVFETSYAFEVKDTLGNVVTDSVAIAAVLNSITIDAVGLAPNGIDALDGFSLTASALNGTSRTIGIGGVAVQVAPGGGLNASFDSAVSETLDSAYAGYSVTMTITIAGETV